MALPLTTDPTPLHADEHGVVRVGGTRVTLHVVIAAFLQGATAEEIAMRYDVLSLPDVYATIAYYLRHRDEDQAHPQAQLRRPPPGGGPAGGPVAGPVGGHSVSVLVVCVGVVCVWLV